MEIIGLFYAIKDKWYLFVAIACRFYNPLKHQPGSFPTCRNENASQIYLFCMPHPLRATLSKI